MWVRAYHETYGLPVTITNCAKNYGSHQFPEKVIPLFTTRALDGRRLPVYASSGNRREWIHVLDHCAAVETVLLKGTPGEVYHVGTGVEASVDELADLVLDEPGLPRSLKETVPAPPAVIAATSATPAVSGANSAGSRGSPSRPESGRPSAGTPTTVPGGFRSSAAARSSRTTGARPDPDRARRSSRCCFSSWGSRGQAGSWTARPTSSGSRGCPVTFHRR
ncbi:NAD-dependent epimerase/dehydratase family protein [Streptomyces sp. NPDC048430]|uniref:NAD-dependent epimerase/dehydratase family protein n=1 Tax=Streptomyces sp. NPDC048430 TaxID=3155388 RepID=UPI0034362027